MKVPPVLVPPPARLSVPESAATVPPWLSKAIEMEAAPVPAVFSTVPALLSDPPLKPGTIPTSAPKS